ncbi:C-type lectin domain family 6 member A-like isoform X3 [Clarias magur]|uniref:C-type lectin domain family 6 member A-like isoform X3 n=1 Tax=Clarias magur TaxID=1594786 RepID=A0A8J4U6K9_CLAMG|nr:C-type lectin domain family 6 member A-like isoform X3 [Clarias magur]
MENSCERSRRNNHEQCHSPTEPRNEDDVKVTTQQQCQTPETCTASSPFDYKIIIFALCLLLLGTLMSLCAVGILYHNKVASTENLSEKHENATSPLMMLDHRVKEMESMYEMHNMKHQELISCNETERLYNELRVKHHWLIFTYMETKHLYEMLKVKYEQVHERITACNEPTQQNCTLCGEGWKSLGLKCYYLSTEKLNWAQSRDHCMEKGGHLVIITSQTEQDFLSSQIGKTHWIGLNDLETEGKWKWVNKQPLNETGVTFWYSAPEGPHEPDNWIAQDPSGENCAALGDENEPETQDDVYVNTQQQFPAPKTHPVLTSFDYKIIISALTLLLLGALTSLCAVAILYHNKVLSTEILIEKYENATATLMVLESKANETQKLHEELKGNCQQVREDLFACNAQQSSQQSGGEWKTLGLNSYYFSAFKLNWAQCRDYCVEKGGHLVIINSQTEQDLVSSQIGETHWIGLNDIDTEGEWMWINNQRLKKTGVTFWYDAPEGPHEPDNWKVQDSSGENCAALGDGNEPGMEGTTSKLE